MELTDKEAAIVISTDGTKLTMELIAPNKPEGSPATPAMVVASAIIMKYQNVDDGYAALLEAIHEAFPESFQ